MLHSTLYQEFIAEKEEILRHKWLWSEREGRDVGFDSALIDWVHHHRAAWRSARRPHRSVDPDSVDNRSLLGTPCLA